MKEQIRRFLTKVIEKNEKHNGHEQRLLTKESNWLNEIGFLEDINDSELLIYSFPINEIESPKSSNAGPGRPELP